MVRVTGLEPAHLTASEPKDTATPLEQTFSYLTKPIIARISAVVKWFLKKTEIPRRTMSSKASHKFVLTMYNKCDTIYINQQRKDR